MITPSQAAIDADAQLRMPGLVPSHVKSGETRDGVVWVASYTGARGAFRAESHLSRSLLTHEQVDTLVAAAPTMTIWELRVYAGGIV